MKTHTDTTALKEEVLDGQESYADDGSPSNLLADAARATSFSVNGSFVRPMPLCQGDHNDETPGVHS